MTSLVDIEVGVPVRVVGVQGQDEITWRLLEMGLTPGVQVVLIGSSLFGDPLELDIRGYRLSIRRSEAARVEVN